MRWIRPAVVGLIVALVPAGLASGQSARANDGPPTGSTVPTSDQTTTTTTATTTTATTIDANADASAKPHKGKGKGTTTTTTTPTTTTVPAYASGTWITAFGYNPEWHGINPPWVPRAPAGSGFGRRIVYSKGQQRVWLIEDNGFITNTHLVSGRLDLPGYGSFHVYSKSLRTFATHNPAITWEYMVRFAIGQYGGAIGFHQIPLLNGVPMQTEAQLGQPLSGGCVRQSHDDAVLVWNWAPVGTLVVVVP
jgi:hypothetical protein